MVTLLTSNNRFSVDRIEGNIAVCQNIENEKIYNIPLEKLPSDISEKDILKLNNDKFVIDEKIKEDREKKIELLTKDLWVKC